MSAVIEIKNLTKDYGEGRGIFGIHLSIAEGEMVGFAGTNGSGKTTTIRHIMGFLQPTDGAVYVNGLEAWKHSSEYIRSIGYVPGEIAFPDLKTGTAFLRSQADFLGVSDMSYANRLIEKLQLDPSASLKRMSKGMKQKTAIVAALMADPAIIVLDEPTTGLDPQTRSVVWRVIGRLRKEQGMTVLLTTHYMEEAADADAVLIIDAGRRVASGTPLELKNAYTGDFITLYGVSETQVRLLGTPYTALRGAYRIEVPDTAAATSLILAHPEIFTDYEITKGRMDDVFLAATGKKVGEDAL